MLEGWAGRSRFFHRFHKSIDRFVIALLDSLEPARVKPVSNDLTPSVKKAVTEVLPCGLDHSFGTEDLNRLVVPVSSTPRTIDLGQRSRCHAKRYNRRIDIACLTDRRVDQSRADRVYLDRFIVCEPSQQIKKMNCLIPELASGNLDIGNRRWLRAAAGQLHNFHFTHFALFHGFLDSSVARIEPAVESKHNGNTGGTHRPHRLFCLLVMPTDWVLAIECLSRLRFTT